MTEIEKPESLQEQKPKSSLRPLLFKAGVLAIVFFAGILVGQGRIAFGFDKQTSLNNQLPANLNYSDVEEVYDVLRANYDGKLSRDELLDGLKAGLAHSSGDPYTEYLNNKDAKQFDEDLNGCLNGVGAQLGKDGDDNIIIVSPIAGFPAAKAGLRPKDIIIEIDGKSTYGMSINDAVEKIRGQVGTKVKLKIIRDKKQEQEFEITREHVCIPSVEYKIENGIGYLKISHFAEDTAGLAQEAANKFKQEDVKGVVLDVRSNPGGLLDAAVDVSSLWLKGKTVLTERRGSEVIKTYSSDGNGILSGIPTVVLINEGSASASEIVAGALKDNKAATLIGEKSYGKGSVQQLQRLKDGSMLKVTVARWYTPSGKNIDKEGIEPSKKVERTEDDYKNDRDPQKDAAAKFLKSKTL